MSIDTAPFAALEADQEEAARLEVRDDYVRRQCADEVRAVLDRWVSAGRWRPDNKLRDRIAEDVAEQIIYEMPAGATLEECQP